MFAPIFCNTYEIQSLVTGSGHKLVVLKFFYMEPKKANEALPSSPFPSFPYAPVAVIILEKDIIKNFLKQMHAFLVHVEEHGIGGIHEA